jgi:hypothetical protein
LNILFICIILPLFIFDGQLLFNYGVFYKNHVCNDTSRFESKQYQRALHYPINNSKILNNISIRYHTNSFQTQSIKSNKCGICILWNILDTFVYAIIPFLIILISSIIIIVKICQRRRSAFIFGGICHKNRRIIATQDNVSIFLIMINILFLIMTGPFNIYLIIESIIKSVCSKQLSTKIFLQLNEYLRLLQNSYHALSFIFYCVAGNKFRKCAFSICQIIYYELFKIIFKNQPKESSTNSCCLKRKNLMHKKPTESITTKDTNKPTPILI